MRRKSLSFCVVLSLSILAMTRAVMADPADRIEWVNLNGWQEVAEGVLQRATGSRVETFSFGEEGMRWSTERIRERIAFLQGEYDKHPSEDLAELIENLESQVEERERSLRISRATAADSFGGGETLAACNPIYDATADAYGLSGSSAPGNGASAYARWYSECGYVGSTFAYAYARATDALRETDHSHRGRSAAGPFQEWHGYLQHRHGERSGGSRLLFGGFCQVLEPRAEHRLLGLGHLP